MSNANYAPPCGLNCEVCEYLPEQCKGCGCVEGKPFWSVQVPSGICPLYDCCRNQRELEHCGQCEEFPCEMFFEFRDPNLSDEESQNTKKGIT